MDPFIHHPVGISTVIRRGVLILALLFITACNVPEQEVTIVFGGDILLARDGEALWNNDPWGDKKELLNLDNKEGYFFANLESPLTEDGNTVGELNLCSDDEQAEWLQKWEISLVSIANNHQNDCDLNGSNDTASILSENGIQSAGMGLAPVFFDTRIGKIAIIADEDVLEPVNEQQLLQTIAETKVSTALVIVSMHWGNEYQAGTSDRQIDLAKKMAEAGADVIWGHHPHVLQKIDWLDTSDGRQSLVMYSLGNLLSDQWMLEDARKSGLISVTFNEQGISEIKVIPLFLNRNRQIQSADEDTRQEIFNRLQLKLLINQDVAVDY